VTGHLAATTVVSRQTGEVSDVAEARP
jgi:hypothetical protein